MNLEAIYYYNQYEKITDLDLGGIAIIHNMESHHSDLLHNFKKVFSYILGGNPGPITRTISFYKHEQYDYWMKSIEELGKIETNKFGFPCSRGRSYHEYDSNQYNTDPNFYEINLYGYVNFDETIENIIKESIENLPEEIIIDEKEFEALVLENKIVFSTYDMQVYRSKFWDLEIEYNIDSPIFINDGENVQKIKNQTLYDHIKNKAKLNRIVIYDNLSLLKLLEEESSRFIGDILEIENLIIQYNKCLIPFKHNFHVVDKVTGIKNEYNFISISFKIKKRDLVREEIDKNIIKSIRTSSTISDIIADLGK